MWGLQNLSLLEVNKTQEEIFIVPSKIAARMGRKLSTIE